MHTKIQTKYEAAVFTTTPQYLVYKNISLHHSVEYYT